MPSSSKSRSSQYDSSSGGVTRSTWVAAKDASASVIDSSGLSLPTEPRRRDATLLQQPDRDPHALLCLSVFDRLVVGHEVEMGDADGNDDVNGDGTVEARDDLVADGDLAAVRVGDHEQPLLSVAGDGGWACADACALERERRDGGQARAGRSTRSRIPTNPAPVAGWRTRRRGRNRRELLRPIRGSPRASSGRPSARAALPTSRRAVQARADGVEQLPGIGVGCLRAPISSPSGHAVKTVGDESSRLVGAKPSVGNPVQWNVLGERSHPSVRRNSERHQVLGHQVGQGTPLALPRRSASPRAPLVSSSVSTQRTWSPTTARQRRSRSSPCSSPTARPRSICSDVMRPPSRCGSAGSRCAGSPRARRRRCAWCRAAA